jgi:cell division protein FtsZ
MLSLILYCEEMEEFVPRIMAVGVGGAGCNSISRIYRYGIKGAELVAINTDAKHLQLMPSGVRRLLIGKSITRGLGAGGFPEIGMKAAETSKDELQKILEGAHLVFLTAGMGGGTGTGAAPVVAEVAKEQGAIVIGVVTYPFEIERVRIKVAQQGIEELRKKVDTLIVIDNNRLIKLFPNLQIENAFQMADEITAKAIRGITETITQPSLINLDFADVRTIMRNGGLAMIGVGEGRGVDRVKEVVENTIKNKLLDVDYSTSTGVLIHLTGGNDLTLGEANRIGELLTEMVPSNAYVAWGARLDPTYEGKVEAVAIFVGVRGGSFVGKLEEEKQRVEIEEI